MLVSLLSVSQWSYGSWWFLGIACATGPQQIDTIVVREVEGGQGGLPGVEKVCVPQ